MAKFNIIVLIITMVLLSTEIHGRIIFRRNEALLNKQKDANGYGTTTDVATGNIITAPKHCPQGHLMDDRKICRRVH